MTEHFRSSQPIYLQLAGRICREIVRGERQVGDKLPSVRDMAIQSSVNPNTMQRVYAELERVDVVETRRGQGTFVTNDNHRLRQLRIELMQEEIQQFVRDMQEMGFSSPEIVQGVEQYLNDATKNTEINPENDEEA